MQPPDDLDDDDLTEIADAASDPVEVWTSSLRDRVPEAPGSWRPPTRPGSPEFEVAEQHRRGRRWARGPTLFWSSVVVVIVAAAIVVWASRSDTNETDQPQPAGVEAEDPAEDDGP